MVNLTLVKHFRHVDMLKVIDPPDRFRRAKAERGGRGIRKNCITTMPPKDSSQGALSSSAHKCCTWEEIKFSTNLQKFPLLRFFKCRKNVFVERLQVILASQPIGATLRDESQSGFSHMLDVFWNQLCFTHSAYLLIPSTKSTEGLQPIFFASE